MLPHSDDGHGCQEEETKRNKTVVACTPAATNFFFMGVRTSNTWPFGQFVERKNVNEHELDVLRLEFRGQVERPPSSLPMELTPPVN